MKSKVSFASCRGKRGQNETNLSEVHQVRNDLCCWQVGCDVGPASNSVLRRELPGLETSSSREVVQRFPEVEDWRKRRVTLTKERRGKEGR